MTTRFLPLALLAAAACTAEAARADQAFDALYYRATVGARECDVGTFAGCEGPLTAKEWEEVRAANKRWRVQQQALGPAVTREMALDAQVAEAEAQVEAMEMVMEIDAASASAQQPIPMPEAPIEAPASSYYDRASAEIAAEQRAIETRQAARATGDTFRGYGDRIDITIDEYGRTSSTKRISGSDSSGDQLRFYDNSTPGLNSVDTIDYDDYEPDYDDE